MRAKGMPWCWQRQMSRRRWLAAVIVNAPRSGPDWRKLSMRTLASTTRRILSTPTVPVRAAARASRGTTMFTDDLPAYDAAWRISLNRLLSCRTKSVIQVRPAALPQGHWHEDSWHQQSPVQISARAHRGAGSACCARNIDSVGFAAVSS